MLRPNLCDYSDACILVKETITVARVAARTPNHFHFSSSIKLTGTRPT